MGKTTVNILHTNANLTDIIDPYRMAHTTPCFYSNLTTHPKSLLQDELSAELDMGCRRTIFFHIPGAGCGNLYFYYMNSL